LTRWTRTLAAAAALSAAAAAAPPAAWAHARLVSASPSDGAVLPTAPRQVTIRFDEPVRALSGTTVVANSGKRPVVAGKPRTHGRVLAIPLRKLGDGDYTVRWRVLSDDGHTVQGVFPFAVGAGRAPPSAIARSRKPPSAAASSTASGTRGRRTCAGSSPGPSP